MIPEEVQRFAENKQLDVRHIEPWHHRLFDTYGNPVVDVFFKKTGAGVIMSRNKVFRFSDKKWGTVYSKKDLNNFIAKN